MENTSLESPQESIVHSLVKTARVIFFGIFIQSTLFSFWGLQFFINQDNPGPQNISIYVVFSLMALLSFIYGIRFFQNYTLVKRDFLIKLEDKKRKEALLLAYAIHLLLLEFVCIVGILVSIFTQKPMIIYPFYLLSLLGMWFSYPQKKLFVPFFNLQNLVGPS